jgi:transposase
MHVCGSEISEQLKIIPARISVIRHKCTKYACRNCEQTAETSRVVTASKPKQPIPQSIASPEALAAVTTAKYCDALPLYRQAEILERGGLEISRSTLANWCIKGGELLKPLWLAMKKHLLSQTLVCADETPLQVLDEPGRKATSKSYMWVYRCSEFSEQPVVLYDYRPGRGQAHPQSFLEGYSGLLLCDGYSVYETLDDVLLAGCWAHVRRKFKDAEKAQPKKNGRVQVALSYISKLYKIETSVKTATAEQRLAARQEKARPVLHAFKAWLDKAAEAVLPKSLLGKAISYTLNQWSKLQTYLQYGEVSIDNNVTERDIRPFTTGRKNWLFAQSVEGAESSAILYSLVMTCRANDINPYFYFRHLFTELPNREKGGDLSDLMPWNVTLDTC